MLKIVSKVRKWGRSIGVVIPKNGIKKEGIKANDIVTLLIAKKSNALKDTFGTLKFKKSTDKIMEEIDKEAWFE